MKLFIILALVCYWLTCCAPSVAELAKTNPEAVVARKDELLAGKSVSKETLMAVVNAYNTLGSSALKAKNYNEAEKTNSKVFSADATSMEDLKTLFENAMEELGGKIDFVLHFSSASRNRWESDF